MFVVSLTYVVELSEVEPHLAAHVEFLEWHYARGHFVASGRKVPRTGGIILARVASREQLDAILAEDPFQQAGVAEYEVTEFLATKVAPGFESIKDSLQ